jgi:hypothetical protein
VAARDPEADARSDRRTLIVGVSIMVGLVVFGIAFGARFGATECRRLDPDLIVAGSAAAGGAPRVGAEAMEHAQTVLGVEALTALIEEHGALQWSRELPLEELRRLGAHPAGVLATGAGAVLVDPEGAVLSGVRFGRGVEVVGDGSTVFAVVVGNVITGQVDALRPLQLARQGVTSSACVDTSAVGSPLSFLHDARDGLLVGLRTDEDGSESVLELRDATRGRVWAPEVALGQAPAGLQGARTSGWIADDVVVLARRASDADTMSDVVLAFDRTSGEQRWIVAADELRDALRSLEGGVLASAPILRLEVIDTASEPASGVTVERLRLLITPDTPADALLPPPLHGPFAALVSDSERQARQAAVDAAPSATVLIDLADGSIHAVRAGSVPFEGGSATLLRSAERTWLLVRVEGGPDLLLRFGG